MCGIAGAIRRHGDVEERVVAGQLQLLAHRGPDSWGVHARGRCAIGQTRLAVIDLVTGDPPIGDESGRIGVAFNGEIYGYRALRDELRAAGHTFATDGDTEVIAHLAEDHEPVDVARKLDGMFAFAVWDERRERLVLGRDRAGKKPLYVWRSADELVFASEIKALLAHPSVPAELDEDVIAPYLRFGYVPSPRTFYRGITSVPPGHVLIVERDLTTRLERYWESPLPGVSGHTRLDVGFDDAAVLVRDALARAVRRRLVSDVPLGAFLSGGIDSSAVVAVMAAEATGQVSTFTIGFEDGEGFDERAYARVVANRYGTDHHEFVVQPDAVDLLERLVWHHDQPFGDSSAIPTYLLSELTRKHVTVALCGDGGDELFAGYERLAATLVVGPIARLPAVSRRALLAAASRGRALAGDRAAKVERFARSASVGLPTALRTWAGVANDDDVLAMTGLVSDWGTDDYDARWARTAGASTLDRALRLNFETYLLDDLLPKVDRTSMAHGLEVRAPFLDHEVVELAMRLPPRHKVRGRSLKAVLKRSMADLLPSEILHRPKRGFGVPLARWFRQDLRPLVSSTLVAPDARVRAHLDGATVERIVAEHDAGDADHGHLLWSLLTLETFLRSRDW
ncbi:MAG TPA: asparagine synthase (glutamine-hydrolyzing) [Acidimicrobiales bacterium]|nr:asparagine synthase (glutamine-hydrolyzing) [Acidimicrobiales bacterium]